MGKFNSKDYKNNSKNAESKNDEKTDKLFSPNKEFTNGLLLFFLGSLLGLLVFVFTYKVLLSPYDINYVIKASIAACMALLILSAVKKATRSKDDRMQAPILTVIVIVFSLTILSGYKEASNKTKDDVRARSKTVEMVTLNSVGEVWFTDKVFKVGTEIQIEVIYNDVLMVNCYNLPVGVHQKIISNGGKLIFRGIVNNPAQIKITY